MWKASNASRVAQEACVVDYCPCSLDNAEKNRWELADQDIPYNADELNRRVVVPDQIRTIVRTFRDRLFTEIFPGRTEVPKTLTSGLPVH
jgi:type I site-specific restriction endonuclease